MPTDWNGTDAIEVTVPAFFEGDYTTTATVTNGQGQTSPASSSEGFTLDKTAPGEDANDNITAPEIDIAEAAGDGIVDPTEQADGVQVQVDIPSTSEPGDVITLTVSKPDGTVTTVTSTVPTNWNGTDSIEVTIPATDVNVEGTYSTYATVTDEAGNVSDASSISNFTYDDGIAPLDAPVLNVAEADDGLVDATDAEDGAIQVSVPTGTVAGDVVTVTVTQPNGSTFDIDTTIPNDWNGTDAIEVTVPVAFDGDYSAVAVVTDSLGQVSTASNIDNFTVDRSELVTPDAPVIIINEAAPDGLVNESEAADGVQVLVTVPQGSLTGDGSPCDSTQWC